MKFIAIIFLGLIASGAGAQTPAGTSSLLVEPRSDAMSDEALLVDVGLTTPVGGVIPILPNGCPLPCTAVQMFEPKPGGTQVTLQIARGDLRLPDADIRLGTFRVTSASAQPFPGVVRVSFRADRDGISISAEGPGDAPSLVVARIAP